MQILSSINSSHKIIKEYKNFIKNCMKIKNHAYKSTCDLQSLRFQFQVFSSF